METPKITQETRFSGLPISGGLVVARVCLFNEGRHNNLAMYKVEGDGLTRERNRVLRAMEVAANQLDTIIRDVSWRVGKAEAQIFSAQQAVMRDSALIDQILEVIDNLRVNAETAVAQVLDEYEAKLSAVDNEYLRERASDIGEIRRRVLDVLANMNPSLQCVEDQHCQRGKDRIIVAEELTPSLTVELDMQRIVGFVTERGGSTSHAAILARALGIPAISGVPDIHGLLSCGTEVLLDGDKGELVIWPKEEYVERARSHREKNALHSPEVVEPIDELTTMANISHAGDVGDALYHQAEGIGLYRTEFEFFAEGRLLSEDEQYECYSSVVVAMEGKPTCFRLLDIGGDKGAPFFELDLEENPNLGLRGARLLLERPDLLKTQARALARASRFGSIDVLYPMIIDLNQFLKLREVFNEAIADLTPGRIRHGVMFEVPGACLQARELLQVAEFGSIGTNDLIQYLFAVDRNNEHVAPDYTPDRPVFWSLLGHIAEAAAETGRTVSVCGEVAMNTKFLPRLLDLGITSVSASPRFIPELRRAAKEYCHSKPRARMPVSFVHPTTTSKEVGS